MSENRRIVRAAGLVGLLTLVSRIAGLVRDAVVGYYFGTGMAADAFFVAFRLPNLLRRFVAEGAMSVAFIPVLTDYVTNRSRAAAAEAASALATVMAAGLAVVVVVGMVWAPAWTALFAPGFVEVPAQFALTVTLTRMVFPYIFLISLVALAAAMLNSLRHFAAPALSPVFLNLSMIATAVFLAPHLAVPIHGLAYGVLIGGVCQLALQVPPLLRYGVRIVPLWRPGHEAVRRALGLMAPMVFGAAVYQINLLVGTVLASVLPAGSVSYLWYAGRVFEFPLGIFAVALGTAALPSFAVQAARGARDELRHSLAFSIRLTNCIVLPATVGIMALATPITSVLFQRGAFGHGEVLSTARALTAFATALWSVSMVRLLVPACYALRDTRAPVIAAACGFVANVTFSVLLMGPIAATGGSRLADAIAALTRALWVVDLRHVGLALATSLSAMVNLIVLAALLRRHLGQLGVAELLPSFLRSLLASLAMLPVLHVIAARADWAQSGVLLAHAAVLLAAIVGGGALFAAVALLLGGDEVQAAMRVVRERWTRTGTGRSQ
jgi:putative peptidoglycan lipid II flippase